MLFFLVLSGAVYITVQGITLSCVPTLPEDQAIVRCTCKNPTKNGVEWLINSSPVTSCSGSVDNSCFPPTAGYTSSVSDDEFYLEINPYSYINCATYSCKDGSTAEEATATTSIAEFVGGVPSIKSEPGTGQNGTIEVTTACLFNVSDIVVNWYTVDGGNNSFIPEESFKTATSCSDTSKVCSGTNAVTLNIGFTHTQKSSRCGNVKIEVYHSEVPSTKLEWTTTGTYCVGEATTTSTSTNSTTTSTTIPTTTTTTTPSTTPSTTPTPITTPSTTPTTTTKTKPTTTPSASSLSDEMIVVIVIVPVGVIALVGTVIFFYRRQMGKRKPASDKRHKRGKHYNGNMRPVQQHQQQPYILYGRHHTGKSTNKDSKRSRSLHNDDRYNWYDGSQVKQNAVYKGDRNLSRLYYNDSLPRYDDYRSGYTRGHAYPSHTSGYHYRPNYHGDSRGHGNRQYSSYPVYSRQQEYINPSYSYMGY